MSGFKIAVDVGPQAVSAGDSSSINLRGGKTGEAVITQLHGRYYEQAVRGGIFMAAQQAVVTTTVGLALTYTGLVISNPVGSTVRMALLKASMMQSVIQATQIEAYAIATGFNAATNVTHTTPATIQPSLVGSGATGQGKADSAATLPTAPLYSLFATQTATATAQPSTTVIDLEGSIVLLPGAYALWVTPAQASVAGLWFGFSWEEVAL